MVLQRVVRQSVADAVYEQLLGNVLDGSLPAGAALPPERLLTEQLGVNRQAVREALQRLAEAGIVDIRHGGATRVQDYRRSAGLDLLPRLLVGADGELDAQVVRAIMELRTSLGTDVARRCAERGGAAVAPALDQTVARMTATDDLAELVEIDLVFWDQLVDGSGNIAYRLAFNALRRTYEPVADVLASVLAPELTERAARRRIVKAVSAGAGAAAATAAQRLLARGEDALRSALEQLDGRGGHQ